MIIQKIILREIRIPLKFQFAQANNSGSRMSLSMVLEIHTKDGVVGYGESCPRKYVTGENSESISLDLMAVRKDFLQEFTSLSQLQQMLVRWKNKGIGNATCCAFELAWLDAWSKTKQEGLTEIFKIKLPKKIAYTLVIPLTSTPGLEQLLPKIKHFHPPEIKLKVNNNHQQTLENIRLLRHYFGKEVSIRFDINGAWEKEEAMHWIPRFRGHGVEIFEQPLAPKRIREMQDLTKELGQEATLLLDESLLDIRQASYFLDHKIGNAFNLKISKNGGLISSLQIYRLTEKYGVPCQLGAHFGETSILAGAAVLLTGMCGKTISAHEGAFSDYLLEEDLLTNKIQFDLSGNLQTEKLLLKPGLAPDIDLEKLRKYTFAKIEINPLFTPHNH